MVTKLTSKGLRVRRPTDAEGQRLVRIVRRGAGTKSHITWRRALIILASAGGNSVKVIADMAQTSPDRVREVIHAFNEAGLECLDPKWAGGRPRIIDAEDRALIGIPGYCTDLGPADRAECRRPSGDAGHGPGRSTGVAPRGPHRRAP